MFKVRKICNKNFWIENDNPPTPPPLALFEKFIRFGSGILPLKPLHCKNVNFTGNFNSVAWGAIVFEQNIQAELGAMIPS